MIYKTQPQQGVSVTKAMERTQTQHQQNTTTCNMYILSSTLYIINTKQNVR